MWFHYFFSSYFLMSVPKTAAGVKRRTQNAERRTQNAERRTQNAERRMHCLLAVSFTCVCLRLAFICWKGPHTIKCFPFQQIKADRKQTQVKLTAGKQCIRRSAFCVRRFTPAAQDCRNYVRNISRYDCARNTCRKKSQQRIRV